MYLTKFSNLTVKPTSPHLALHFLSYFLWRGTSTALWNQLQAVHLLDFTAERFVAVVFNVHAYLLTILPQLLLSTPGLAACVSEGAPDGFSWTAGLRMGFIRIGVFLSPLTESGGRGCWCHLCSLSSCGENVSDVFSRLWWVTPESYQLLNWVVSILACSSACY